MKSVDDVVAELRLRIAKNLARDVGIVSIDCEDALALCQMAADFAVLLAEGKRAIATLQREADGLREALDALAADTFPGIIEREVNAHHGGDLDVAELCGIIRDHLLRVARLSPQVDAEKGSDRD